MSQQEANTNSYPVELFDGFAEASARLFLGEPEQSHEYVHHNAATCPDCGAGMVRLGVCCSCPLCGFGSCG
jgi:hypothetical protein